MIDAQFKIGDRARVKSTPFTQGAYYWKDIIGKIITIKNIAEAPTNNTDGDTQYIHVDHFMCCGNTDLELVESEAPKVYGIVSFCKKHYK